LKTYLECIPCFFSQALKAAKMANLSDEDTLKILHEIGKKLPSIELSDSPPKIGKLVYGLAKEFAGLDDPYADVKKRDTELALSFLPGLIEYVENSQDEIDAALRVSAAGNILDSAIQNEKTNIDDVLKKALSCEHECWDKIILDKKLREAKTLLILGDNAGETVFDKVLLGTLSREYPELELKYSVRNAPVINDATFDDAIAAGIDEFAEIISTGSDAPGILLDEISKKFAELFWNFDIIISKGQGNYETLNEVERDIFFVLTVKCNSVGRHLKLPVGSSVLYYKP